MYFSLKTDPGVFIKIFTRECGSRQRIHDRISRPVSEQKTRSASRSPGRKVKIGNATDVKHDRFHLFGKRSGNRHMPREVRLHHLRRYVLPEVADGYDTGVNSHMIAITQLKVALPNFRSCEATSAHGRWSAHGLQSDPHPKEQDSSFQCTTK